MSVEKVSVEKMSVEKVSVEKMSVEKTSRCQSNDKKNSIFHITELSNTFMKMCNQNKSTFQKAMHSVNLA